jgi:hypothetical protein
MSNINLNLTHTKWRGTKLLLGAGKINPSPRSNIQLGMNPIFIAKNRGSRTLREHTLNPEAQETPQHASLARNQHSPLPSPVSPRPLPWCLPRVP